MSVKFNPSRLKLARTRRQLTFKALAEKVGLTPRMVSEYEKDYCRSEPPPETVEAFSYALNYPIDFLLGEDSIETLDKGLVSFRSLKKMKAAQEHAALSAGQIGILISEFFEEKFNMLTVKVPDYRNLYVTPSVAAKTLRDEWSLGNASISNMVHLLEKNGVRVFSLSENTQDVDAFSFWKGDTPYVFLNTQKSAERSRFDAAHELGHLVLHKHGSSQGKEAETEADSFAAEFLMPSVTLLPYKDHHLSLNSILELKHNWKVSAMALIVQLKNEKVITEWQYKSLIIEANKRGLRTQEIDSIQREKSLIIEKILTELKKDGLSLTKFAKQLNLPLDEVSALLFKHSVAAQNGSPRKSTKLDTPRHLQLVK